MPKTTYVWDELSDNVAAEYENGVLAVGYTHEPGISGNLLSQNRNGVTSYYHYDGRGDTVALTDDAGNVTDTKEYNAWGNVIVSAGSTVTPYQHGGQHGIRRDSTTGSNFSRSRVFAPTTGRWLDGNRRGTYVLNLNSPLARQGSIENESPLEIEVVDHGGRFIPRCRDGRRKGKTKWVFRLSAPAPCNGFVVQRVEVSCELNICARSSEHKETFEYFEAWRIEKRETSSKQSRFGEDTAGFEFADCSLGNYKQTTEIRFYCNADVGIEDPDNKETSIPGWDPSKGDPAYYGDPKGCKTQAGSLTSSGKADFWETGPGLAAKGHREFNLTWECCPQKKPCCGNGADKTSMEWNPDKKGGTGHEPDN